MKKLTTFLVSLMLLVFLLPATFAADTNMVDIRFYDTTSGLYLSAVQLNQVQLTLNGASITGDVPAVLQAENGGTRTLIPVRLVSEQLGAEVIWLSDTSQVMILYGDDTIMLTIGSSIALVNGQSVTLPDEIPATLVYYQGSVRTLVPLRFVAEELGAVVNWDGDTMTASISTTGDNTSSSSAETDTTVTDTSANISASDTGLFTGVQSDAAAQTFSILTDYTTQYVMKDFDSRLVVDLLGAELSPDLPSTLSSSSDFIADIQYVQLSDSLGYGCDHTVRVILTLPENITLEDNLTVLSLTNGVCFSLTSAPVDTGTATTPVSSTARTVVIDAGHGGTDPGAYYESTSEKDINLAVALKVQPLLIAQGYNVIMTRSTDVFVDLYERAAIANNINADLFVSIHSNASATSKTAQGILTYCYPGSTRGETCGKIIQKNITAATGANDRGVLSENYVVLRETNMCAVLVELGFMSTHDELVKLVDDSYQTKLAQGIADGIVEYLNTLDS
ncbi:MAG: N-acetylmuramoyl-L-alanine amidase [Oscillospiraceae bacterium]|nr:N-acetylmuramoyl-L-alanine amidase [Oscillospiraceae bacterium]